MKRWLLIKVFFIFFLLSMNAVIFGKKTFPFLLVTSPFESADDDWFYYVIFSKYFETFHKFFFIPKTVKNSKPSPNHTFFHSV
jgi:hypothetical protein